jgi:hypothetical protein
MSTAQTAPLPAPVAPPEPRSNWLPITVGSVIATFGVIVALGGIAILGIFGSDGTLDTSRSTIATPTSALVSKTANIEGMAEAAQVIGRPTLHVSTLAHGDDGVFVGIGRAKDVDRYLAGASVETVQDFDLDPLTFDGERRAGDVKPAAPDSQRFWLAKSTDPMGGSLDWKLRDGNYKVVVMNTDASKGVTADAKFGMTVPHLTGIAVGLTIFGLIVLAGGIVLIVVGTNGRRRNPAL